MEMKELITPATFVDREEETGAITPAKFNPELKKQANKKSFEEKMYLVLVQYDTSLSTGEPSDERTWEIFKGRTAARDFIKIVAEYVDLFETLVITEGVKLENYITAYQFMKHIEGSYDDGFDIDDYVQGDDEDYQEDEEMQDGVYLNGVHYTKYEQAPNDEEVDTKVGVFGTEGTDI